MMEYLTAIATGIALCVAVVLICKWVREHGEQA